MALTGAIVSVSTTATALAAEGSISARRSHAIQNVSSVDVFLGDAGVTTTAYGHKLAAGASLTIDLDRSEALYGIVASSTANVAVLSAGLAHSIR